MKKFVIPPPPTNALYFEALVEVLVRNGHVNRDDLRIEFEHLREIWVARSDAAEARWRSKSVLGKVRAICREIASIR